MLKDRIKTVRNGQSMTQAEFGKATGKNRDIISNYESGRVIPDDTFIQLIAMKYGYRVDWIRTGEGDPRPKESLAFNVIQEAKQAVKLDPEEIKERLCCAIKGMKPERVVLMWQLFLTSRYVNTNVDENEKAED